mmetsp:Transcript_20209/g.31009  ORF Transcript_20209/g.31009 Transcript_20209/m.31009 type:complete len:220 (+) Transcript_20209:281-940(+)
MWEKSLLFDDDDTDNDDAAIGVAADTVDVSFDEFPMLVESVLQAVTVDVRDDDEDDNEEENNTGGDNEDGNSSSLVAIATNELSSNSAEENASSFDEPEPAAASAEKESIYAYAYGNSAVNEDVAPSSTEEAAVQVHANETTHADGPAATVMVEEEAVLDDFQIVSDDDGGAILSDDNNEEGGVGFGVVGREEEQDAWLADKISRCLVCGGKLIPQFGR